MHAYRIIVGTDQDRHGNAIGAEQTDASLAYARRNAAARFGGWFETGGAGGYVHHDGRLAIESAIAFTILADIRSAVEAWAIDVARALRQESVVLIHPDGSANFVEPDYGDGE